MKKLIILSSLSFLFMGNAMAQHEGHSHEAPAKTEVAAPLPDSSLTIKELVFDFGKIPQGKPVHHVFEIGNAGNQPLKLVNVQASCGCTTPEWDKDKEIAPGGAGSIRVGYNAAAEGPFNKVITITYNENQTRQINIKGEVWKTPAASAPANAATNDLK
jgi:hypothetical protein